jgi:hypothetical protein
MKSVTFDCLSDDVNTPNPMILLKQAAVSPSCKIEKYPWDE